MLFIQGQRFNVLLFYSDKEIISRQGGAKIGLAQWGIPMLVCIIELTKYFHMAISCL